MVDGYNIGARNQHADSGAYEFHIHRAYIIYVVVMDISVLWTPVAALYFKHIPFSSSSSHKPQNITYSRVMCTKPKWLVNLCEIFLSIEFFHSATDCRARS